MRLLQGVPRTQPAAHKDAAWQEVGQYSAAVRCPGIMQGGGDSAEQAQALEEKRAAKDVLSDLEFIGSCAGPSQIKPRLVL